MSFQNLFGTLLSEASKQRFNDINLFMLFDHIMMVNGKYTAQIVDVLLVYSRNYNVPEQMVRSLENILSLAEYCERTLVILQNLIHIGQTVSNKTLHILVDHLYRSINSRLRYNAFKLLEKVRQNQDMDDDIFQTFELTKAGFALNKSESSTKSVIIDYIQIQTGNGMQLPIDTKLAVEKEINARGVLKIFYNVSKNKQIISINLLNVLIGKFSRGSNDDDIILIGIFENAVKNNQTLPQELLDKLEKALTDKKHLEDKLLPVFIYLAQKGEKLSRHVIDKLLDRLSNESDLVLKQELLSALGSLIDANQTQIEFCKEKIDQILIREIKSDNSNIQKLCIKVIRILATVTSNLSDEVLRQLIQVGTDCNCEATSRNEIYSLFHSTKENNHYLIDNQSYRDQMKLANLEFHSSVNLLDQLSRFVDSGIGFLAQNYNQLKNIIEKDVCLQPKALAILQASKGKAKMTDELVESLVVLHESTMSENIRNACLQILSEASKSGKLLTNRADRIVNAKANREKNIRQFIKSQLYTELKEDFHCTGETIDNILGSLNLSKKAYEIDNLEDLIELSMKENPVYYENQSFVFLIEQCLLQDKVKATALPCYAQMIKRERYKKVQDCLQKLAQNFNESDDEHSDLLFPLIEAIYWAMKLVQLPASCLQLLEDNLDHDDESIRSYAFKTLRKTINSDQYTKSNKFAEWCDQTLANLTQNSGVTIEKTGDYMDLLEILVSVKFLDVHVFKVNKKETWKRELLISSLFATHEAYQADQMDFYTNWLLVEDKFKYHKSVKILSLMQMCRFDSIAQIIELIWTMPQIAYDEIIRMLSLLEAPYENFKHEWCLKKIQLCLANRGAAIQASYLNELVERFCFAFHVQFIDRLLQCIQSIDNLREFEHLIEFCAREHLSEDDLSFQSPVQLNDLKYLLEAKHLCNLLAYPPGSLEEERCLMAIFLNLLRKDWQFEQLSTLVDAFNAASFSNKCTQLVDMFSIVHQYNLTASSTFRKCNAIVVETKTFIESIRKLNKLAIENNFQQEGKIKDVSELLAELKKNNVSNTSLIDYVNTGQLRRDLEQVKSETYSSTAYSTATVIFGWNEKQILLWSKEVRKKPNSFGNAEAIAVIKRANFLITGHTLTDTQILCSLIALKSDGKVKGKLLEMATGEGKSTIVCILAIINGMLNKQVHVITSSPVLAERDAKSKTKLFKWFDLSCSDNNDKTVYMKGAKECYKADIVYGEGSQFQFDVLRDNYSQLGTMGARKCEVAIVDEVDSMLIDDSSKIARLSSSVAGMDHFQAMYVLIWQRLIAIKEKFIMFNSKMYFIEGKIDFENGKITLEFLDASDNELKKVEDLEYFLATADDVSAVGEALGEDLDEYLMKSLTNYIDDQIKGKQVFVPHNFGAFVEKQKAKWIMNAVEALNYQENIHYVVQEGQIKPVDYFSTGIVQSSTNWSDGLHQFLQLKHNLKMTSETFTTNFLSNIGFIGRYAQVYGLTGTLGSDKARSILKSVYHVELVNVPQRRQKQYLELEPIVSEDEDNWLKAIARQVLLDVKKERGILIICETIEHANRISETLKTRMRANAIKLYTMNNMNQEKNVEKILRGEVIIATNLAGRGTDIQTDEIEETGGLHVMVTFMPSNQRVEDQAFGRTARQGKRGTGLMFLNGLTLLGYTSTATSDVKKQRDSIESRMLDEFHTNDLKLIQLKDKLFGQFCTFINKEIRLKIREKHNGVFKTTMNMFTDVMPTVYEANVLAAVEEQWAMFLRNVDDKTVKLEEAEKKCEELIVSLRNEFLNDQLIKNAYYYTCIGYDIVINEWSILDASKAARALEYFEKAIQLEPKPTEAHSTISSIRAKARALKDNLTKADDQATSRSEKIVTGVGAAHLGVAWTHVLIKETSYKEKSLEAFNNALISMSNEMSVLNTTQILMEQKQQSFVNSDLYKQLNVKVTILGSYLNGIQACIDATKRSLRMIDLIATTTTSKDKVLERMELFSDLNRHITTRTLTGDFKLSNSATYCLALNHLTTREDNGTRDQAIQTLKNVFDNKCLDTSTYSDIRLKLKQVDLDRIQSALFNQNKEFKDLTKDAAYAKLKEQRSYWNAFRVTNSYDADMTITSNDARKLKKEFKNRQLNDLLIIVDEQASSDTNLRFDIVIKKANENEINRHFQPNGLSPKGIKLSVDFDNLGDETVKAKLKTIKARSVNIEMVLSKANLLKLINDNVHLESGQLCITEMKVFEKVSRKELLKRVSEMKTDATPCFIKFENLEVDQAEKLIDKCPKTPKVLFLVSFIDIYDFHGSGLTDGQVNFYFDNMSNKTAQKVIPALRTDNFEFCLEFQKLTSKQVELIVKNASMDQETMEIRKVKNMSELYMKGAIPTSELAEFATKGIEHILEINEKQFVPWRSVIAVAILGTAQIILGGVLVATGFGSTVGMGLITEGLADMFTAYRAYSNRQFTWTDYCKQKAISLVISAASAGYSKMKEGLKDAVKGVKTLTTEASKEVLEQAGTQVVSNAKTAGQTLIKTSKNLKSLAFKHVGVKAGEAVVRESLNTGVQCLSNFSFDLIKPKICEHIQLRVRSAFANIDLMRLMRKMYAIDLVTKATQLQSRVEQIVGDTLNPRNDFVQRQWDSIGLPLIKGILSDSSNFGSTISMSVRIVGTLNGLYQVQALIDNVVKELCVKLDLADRNSMTFTLVLHRTQKVNKDSALSIANEMKELKILNANDGLNMSSSNVEDDCDELKGKLVAFERAWRQNKDKMLKSLNKDNAGVKEEDVNKSIQFMNAFYDRFVQIELDDFSTIIKSVADKLSEQMVRIIDSQLIQPWSTLAVSGITDSLSKRLQSNYLVNREQNSESHEADQKKYDELKKKDNLTPEEAAFMNGYGKFRTFAEQINYNAKDHCTAYSQCEMAHHAAQDDRTAGSSSNEKEAKKTAAEIRNGKEANIAEMMATAKKNEVTLKIVDDKDYVLSQEEIDSGVEVIYVERGAENKIGHAYYLDKNTGKFVDPNSEGNDCFYACFSKILEQRGGVKVIFPLISFKY